MAKVTFTESGAQRIIAATRAYERGNRDQPPIKFRQPADDAGQSLRLVRAPYQWPPNTEVECSLVYEQSCEDPQGSGSGSGPSGEDTISVINWLHTIPAGGLVYAVMARNGCWYAVASACPEESAGSDVGYESSGSGCGCVTIGGEDLTAITGYNADGVQLLGHRQGCLEWFDTVECASGS